MALEDEKILAYVVGGIPEVILLLNFLWMPVRWGTYHIFELCDTLKGFITCICILVFSCILLTRREHTLRCLSIYFQTIFLSTLVFAVVEMNWLSRRSPARRVAFIKVHVLHGGWRTNKIGLDGYVVDVVKDAVMMYFKCNGIVQDVPQATKRGNSLINLPLMRILQRNLKRTTDTLVFIAHIRTYYCLNLVAIS
jgi:hypothetical protein